MTNLNKLTIDLLLMRIETINRLKPTYTQLGLDLANCELSAIEAELDSRMPRVEFRTLLDRDFQSGFHWYVVGFEPIYPFDAEILPDDYGLQLYA